MVGPAGAAGAVITRDRLAVALATDRMRIRRHDRVLVRFAITTPAHVRVTISGTATRALRVTADVRPGRRTLRVPGPLRPGRYVLTLSAGTSDGQHASDRLRLDVTRH